MLELKVLGTGCPKCKKLAENAEAAAQGLGVEYALTKVTNINEIVQCGVMMTPALMVNGEVKLVGKAASVEEIQKLLQ